MLFNLEADTGDTLVGYLVPDSAEATPRLCLVGRGVLLWSGDANVLREELVRAGRHRRGLCGFRIGPPEVIGLAEVTDLELRDISTGLTVYRRRAATVARRLFRLETRLRPSRGFDHAMERLFQGWYPGVERFGPETVDQVLLLGNPSVYASGRVHVPAHAGLTDAGTAVAIGLRDPHEELAERLAILSGAFGPVERLVPTRERLAWRAALSALDGVDVQDMRTLRRTMRRIDPDVAATLSNPLTRQLTCAGPGELCAPDAVSSALRLLSGFEVVAPDCLPGVFEASLGTLLGTPVPSLAPPTDAVVWIADALSEIGSVDAILECDLAVYSSVSSVFEQLSAGLSHG